MNFYPDYELRLRSGWEAADLGILIWRKRPFAIIFFYALPYCAVIAFAYLILKLIDAESWFNNSIMIIIFYTGVWLKPLFNRITLYICANIFFNNAANIRHIFRGLFGDLLWRRFSPFRGVFMPLRVLERASGAEYVKRKKQLASGGINNGAALTVFCAALNIALFATLYIFLYSSGELLGLFEDAESFWKSVSVFYFILINLSSIFIDTIYIAMSFGIYINSRVIVEGWDLQFIFNRLARLVRITHPARPAPR